MTACIRLDQWILNIEYDYTPGDDYYSAGWIDLDILSGMIELENSEELLAMTADEVYSCQRLFGEQIQKRLIQELRDD